MYKCFLSERFLEKFHQGLLSKSISELKKVLNYEKDTDSALK